MQMLTANLGRVGLSRLSGLGSRDDGNEWLRTLTNMTKTEVIGVFAIDLYFVRNAIYVERSTFIPWCLAPFL